MKKLHPALTILGIHTHQAEDGQEYFCITYPSLGIFLSVGILMFIVLKVYSNVGHVAGGLLYLGIGFTLWVLAEIFAAFRFMKLPFFILWPAVLILEPIFFWMVSHKE